MWLVFVNTPKITKKTSFYFYICCIYFIQIMADSRYIALLRGINVGGNNIIKMVDLKASFESMGFSDVVTYIQSGNVLFNSTKKDKAKLEIQIEKALSETFNYKSRVVIIAQQHLQTIVKEAPKDFGVDAAQYRYDVLFLKEPLTAKEAITNIKTREGVDSAHAGQGVLYFSRLIAKAGQSYLSEVVKLPIYKEMTIRNWNTTTKLLTL